VENWIIIGIVAAILFLASRYIYKEKKKGTVCVGCPYGGSCSGSCGGCAARSNEKVLSDVERGAVP